MDNDRIRFIRVLIEDNPGSFGDHLYCPECVNIEDDQYCCTTCWGSQSISVGDILEQLVTEVEANVKTS